MLEDVYVTHNSHGSAGQRCIYSYAVDGVEYRMKSTIFSAEADAAGDSCTIWYNPKKPQEAQPFRYGSKKVYNIILAIGIVLIPLGLVLIGAGAAAQ